MDAFVFTGQGSQRLGMGANFFDEVSEFRDIEGEINDLLGYSIRTLCLEDPEKKLHNTVFTQPALYVVNALHYFKAHADGLRPEFLAGHSLGEYNALHAAGVFDFMTGLRLVKKRGELMGQARNGGMAAVIGMNAERVTQLIHEHALSGIDVANFNSPVQTIISGPVEDITRAAPLFGKAGADAFIPLPVSAAFHSRYMEAAAIAFDRFLSEVVFQEPTVLVMSNVTAKPYKNGDSVVSPRELLVKQISSPVQWTKTIHYLLESGASTFHEIGPGDILSRLIQRIRQDYGQPLNAAAA